MIRKQLKKCGAFTLIELIMVVAILGILATMLIPKALDSRKDAQNSAAKANAQVIATAYERASVQDKLNGLTTGAPIAAIVDQLKSAGYLDGAIEPGQVTNTADATGVHFAARTY